MASLLAFSTSRTLVDQAEDIISPTAYWRACYHPKNVLEDHIQS
jgi:hypothetical protein